MSKIMAKISVKAECYATYKTDDGKIVTYFTDCKDVTTLHGPIRDTELLKIADDVVLDVAQVIYYQGNGTLIDGEKRPEGMDMSLLKLETKNVCIELEENDVENVEDKQNYFRHREKRLCYSNRLVFELEAEE